MPTLALVRHAKSDWGSPELDDHDRPLNDRGRRDAPEMARRLAATGFSPDRLLTSTALRARTTAAYFGAALYREPELVDRLYGAPADVLLETARTSGADSVLIVAHDPGMADAVDRLSGGEWPDMPTCAVAVFLWDADDWDAALASPPDRRSFDAPGRISRRG